MTRKQAIILVIVLCVIFLGFPFFGPHTWGYWGWSPFGVALVVLMLLAFL